MKREKRIQFNSLLKKHRSHLAPRRFSGVEKSVSFEQRDLLSDKKQTSMLKRRSRKRSEDEDDDDKMVKVNNEPKERKENLFRDRSPIKVRLAETGKKVINMMWVLDISEGPKPDTGKADKLPAPSQTQPSNPAEPSLHSQMEAFL